MPKRSSFSCIERVFPEARYGGFSRIDSTIAFYLRINALLKSTDVVIDVGCGRGSYKDDPVPLRRSLRILKGKVGKVIGLDPDPAAANNPFLDEFLLISHPRSKWPLSDECADMVVADWTLEHVESPDEFFSELARVLKPNGYFCARTTNVWGLAGMVARIIPERYHARILRRIQPERQELDIFPTHYKCNSVLSIRRRLNRYGLEGVVVGYPGFTGYLQFSCALLYLGHVLESMAPHYLRHVLMVFAQKS